MMVLHVYQMWGFPRKHLLLKDTSGYSNTDYRIIVNKTNHIWFIQKEDTEIYCCTSKTDKDEYIHFVGDLMFIDLDKIDVAKK